MGPDPELLRLELGELKLDGFDLSLTGFGDLELKDLLTERMNKPPITRAGPDTRPSSRCGPLICPEPSIEARQARLNPRPTWARRLGP